MPAMDFPLHDLGPLAIRLQQAIRDTARSAAGTRETVPVPALDEIVVVLAALHALYNGPRYAAHMLSYHDGLGNHAYEVVDNHTGHVLDRYDGYFAGQDARSHAAELNGRADEREAASTRQAQP